MAKARVKEKKKGQFLFSDIISPHYNNSTGKLATKTRKDRLAGEKEKITKKKQETQRRLKLSKISFLSLQMTSLLLFS